MLSATAAYECISLPVELFVVEMFVPAEEKIGYEVKTGLGSTSLMSDGDI